MQKLTSLVSCTNGLGGFWSGMKTPRAQALEEIARDWHLNSMQRHRGKHQTSLFQEGPSMSISSICSVKVIEGSQYFLWPVSKSCHSSVTAIRDTKPQRHLPFQSCLPDPDDNIRRSDRWTNFKRKELGASLVAVASAGASNVEISSSADRSPGLTGSYRGGSVIT